MFPNLAPGEMMVVLILAVVLFGKKLPEVGRSLGKGIVEFKKGLRGIEEEFDISSSTSTSSSSSSSSSSRNELSRVTDEDSMISVPKFEPPTSAPYIQPSPSEAGPKLS